MYLHELSVSTIPSITNPRNFKKFLQPSPHKSMNNFHPNDIRSEKSPLGPNWFPVYSCPVDFKLNHFEKALRHVISEPNYNSTAIMRAEIISEKVEKTPWTEESNEYFGVKPVDSNTMKLVVNIDDLEPRIPKTDLLTIERTIVRRIIPRNPQRDPIINQSCLIYTDWQNGTRESMLIAYVPHLPVGSSQCPFYLPPVLTAGILFHDNKISVHYQLFEEDQEKFHLLEENSRILRIALHLLTTAYRHSRGVMTGYEKRVHHDMILDKVMFQNKYIELKHKYAKSLVENWVEKTDPKKHVHEDIAIAAFLIVLWNEEYGDDEFEFLDLGCGNGLLVNILINEGYSGTGIDARARKSWITYSEKVQNALKEQVIVPEILLDEISVELNGKKITREDLLNDDKINTMNYKTSKPLFLIGNHSDELTCWMPLFGHSFMVIPCCSHALSGAKTRFSPTCESRKSKYAALVDHVLEIAGKVGWETETEILRIPSTRNAAIIGRRGTGNGVSVKKIIEEEGGAQGWIERTMALMGKAPRGH